MKLPLMRRIHKLSFLTCLLSLSIVGKAHAGPSGPPTFNNPLGIAVDAAGQNVYVADTYNNSIRKLTPPASGVTWVASTFAGANLSSPQGQGFKNGVAASALFAFPNGVALDASGNVYVADWGNGLIRIILPPSTQNNNAWDVYTYSNATNLISTPGPVALAVDINHTVYVADPMLNSILAVKQTGIVSIFAGTGKPSPVGIGQVDGPASAARFNQPMGVAVDGALNVYVADTKNNCIRMISNGIVTTIAGSLSGKSGSADGTGPAAQFNQPYGIAVDSTGTHIYVADNENEVIRKITKQTSQGTNPSPIWVVTTLAGHAGWTGTTDGTGSVARFCNPTGLAVDGAGNVYVADTNFCTIRKITPAGVVTTICGVAGTSGNNN